MKPIPIVATTRMEPDGETHAETLARVDAQIKIEHEARAKRLHISGRRWFQKTYGNTYHSVRIFMNGEQVAYLPFAYGYGDQFLQSALDWLKANGHAPADAEYGTLYLRETLGGTYDVADVERKRDL